MGSKIIKLKRVRTCTTCKNSTQGLRTKGVCGKCFGYDKFKPNKEKVGKLVRYILKEERGR